MINKLALTRQDYLMVLWSSWSLEFSSYVNVMLLRYRPTFAHGDSFVQ